MRCQFCSHEETRVVNKRDGDGFVRRRRECVKCKKRFTTYERADIEIVVMKKDGRREQFNREKLKGGIVKACEKRDISHERIDKMINDIEERLRRQGKEIKSEFIGRLVMNRLKSIDKVAYIRFASVYQDFQDVQDFKKEIKELE